MNTRGRVVLVTGAAGGVGRVLCEAFLDLADTVIAVDLNSAGLTDLAAKHPGAPLHIQSCDITDLAQMRTMVDDIVARYGGVDVVIANAGGVRDEVVGNYIDTWERDIALNLTGSAYTVEAVRPVMETAGGGAIVIIGSVNGLQFLGHPAYSAAKAALVGHTRSLACMLGPKNIRVNLLAPGTVRTPAWEERLLLDPTILEKIQKWYPRGRVLDPKDVASVAVFLASDAARMVHGIVLPVDGGLTAGNQVLATEIS